MTEKEQNNLFVLLDTIIMIQMQVENLEVLQTTKFNTKMVKKRMNDLLKEITPIAEQQYYKVFMNGESETQSIILEYEKLVRFISTQKLPQKVILTQMVEAFNFEPKTIEATTHRILKKHENTRRN